MSVIQKLLIGAKQAESSQTTQYTTPSVKAIIDKFTITNTSAADATLSVSLVAFGGSPSDANLITKQRTVAPGETYVANELTGHVLEAGQSISTIASAASALTIRCSGREIG